MKRVLDFSEWPTIEIELEPLSRKVLPGKRIKLSWKVENAESIYLIKKVGSPFEISGLAVAWNELEAMGKAVDSEGEVLLDINSTTTFIIAAVGRAGRWAKSTTLLVDQKEKDAAVQPKTWFRFDDLPDPEDFLRLDMRDRDLHRAILCAVRGPEVELSVDGCCFFTDQTAHLEWSVTCANCADMWVQMNGASLEEDLTVRSGTVVGYYFEGGGETPGCSLTMRGDGDADHSIVLGTEPGSMWSWTILAEDHRGRTDIETIAVWFLPRPIIEGCSPGRRAEIEAAILELCCLLHRGCIETATRLDRSVTAFRDGHLSRTRIALDLMHQITNLHLITFKCNDVDDVDWRGGVWDEYSNHIELQWSPSHRPYLAYIILHELLHKVGFNGDLSRFYTDAQIEHQVNQVARVCFPQLPPALYPED